MSLLLRISFAIVVLLSSCNKDKAKPGESVDDVISQAQLVNVSSATKMILIGGGKYKPFFGDDTAINYVMPFMLDETPVTNEQYLQFVTAGLRAIRANNYCLQTNF